MGKQRIFFFFIINSIKFSNTFFFLGYATQLGGFSVPQQGTEPKPYQRKPRILITKPGGNSLNILDNGIHTPEFI